MGLGWGKGVLSRHQFLILSNLVCASKSSISANHFASQKFTQEVAHKRYRGWGVKLHSYFWGSHSGFDERPSLLRCYYEESAKQLQTFPKIVVSRSSGLTVRWLDRFTLDMKALIYLETSARPNIPEHATRRNKFSSAKHSEGALPVCWHNSQIKPNWLNIRYRT